MGRIEREKQLKKKHDREANARRIEKEKLEIKDQEPIDVPDSELPIEEVETAQPIEKGYLTESDLINSISGPTSFEELDAQKIAREQAWEVSQLTYNVQDLVYNITGNIGMSPEEKANAIGKVGTDFGKRLKNVSPGKIEKSVDMDSLELQVILAKHKRKAGIIERVGDWISKARVDTDPQNPYPVSNKAEVLFTIEKAIKTLEDESVTEGIKTAIRGIIPLIKKAADQFEISSLDSTRSSIVVEKDLQGNYRAVMWPTNNFEDLDHDIITEAAHEEYVEWVNKNMDLSPVFTHWHMPELVRKNKTDFVSYSNGFMLASAPLEKDEAIGLMNSQLVNDLGMSHGTIPLEWHKEGNQRIITKYRMVEMSDLPLKNAANPFTDFEIISKEAQMKPEELEKYLSSFVGEDKAKQYLEKGIGKQTALRDAGVKEAAKTDTPETPVTDPKAAQPGVVTNVVNTTQPDMQAILKAVREDLDVDGLNEYLQKAGDAMEKLPILENIVKELSKDSDEVLAEKISPANNPLVWQKARASQNPDTKLTETEADKALEKSTPKLDETYWLSEITKTEPIKQGGA